MAAKKTEKEKSVIDKIFKDEHNKTVIAQWPNKWAWIFIGGWLFARTFEDSGLLEWLGWAVFVSGLVPWAYLEMRYGVNYWRKFLGLAVLLIGFYAVIDRMFAN